MPSRRGPIASPAIRSRRASRTLVLSSRDWVVLGLLLVEKLSLVEAAVTMGVTASRLRRDYEAAVGRVRRSLSPLLRRPAPLRRAS